MSLTPKQEKFCQKYIETGSAAEAYRLAYDAKNMKPITIRRRAAEQLDHSGIAARVCALQLRVLDRHDVTVDSITKELDEDRSLARELGQPSAAITAVLGKAKLHGLLVEKQEMKLSFGQMTEEQLDAEIKRSAAEAGVSLAPGGEGKA